MTIATDISYKLAGEGDDLQVMSCFASMLEELVEIGHDVLPTEGNEQFYWEFVFEPAIRSGSHGIVLAMEGDECIGVYYAVVPISRIEMPPNRAFIHGAWVSPEHRKHGVASRMMEISHARLRELGYAAAVSHVLKRNTASVAWCRNSGAEFIGAVVSFNL